MGFKGIKGGHWTQDSGMWTLDTGQWTLEGEMWTLDRNGMGLGEMEDLRRRMHRQITDESTYGILPINGKREDRERGQRERTGNINYFM